MARAAVAVQDRQVHERCSKATTPRLRGHAPKVHDVVKVLEALKGGPKTISEIANATGIATGTVSTLLTKLRKCGEVVKAERGYRLPDAST